MPFQANGGLVGGVSLGGQRVCIVVKASGAGSCVCRQACWLEICQERKGLAWGGAREGWRQGRLWSVTNAGCNPASPLPFPEPEGLPPPLCARLATGHGKYRCLNGRSRGLRACEARKGWTLEFRGLGAAKL